MYIWSRFGGASDYGHRRASWFALLQCCIAAKCYSLGARFLDDQPIFGVDPVATGLTPVHFLRHFYYGGIVYIGVKQWKDAMDCLLMVRECWPSQLYLYTT